MANELTNDERMVLEAVRDIADGHNVDWVRVGHVERRLSWPHERTMAAAETLTARHMVSLWVDKVNSGLHITPSGRAVL
ncbi:MAG: hypothetical protein LUE27_00395 [Clostridia bacterium]|nr:hypothetical protein [Clostridia bacterium]